MADLISIVKKPCNTGSIWLIFHREKLFKPAKNDQNTSFRNLFTRNCIFNCDFSLDGQNRLIDRDTLFEGTLIRLKIIRLIFEKLVLQIYKVYGSGN